MWEGEDWGVLRRTVGNLSWAYSSKENYSGGRRGWVVGGARCFNRLTIRHQRLQACPRIAWKNQLYGMIFWKLLMLPRAKCVWHALWCFYNKRLLTREEAKLCTDPVSSSLPGTGVLVLLPLEVEGPAPSLPPLGVALLESSPMIMRWSSNLSCSSRSWDNCRIKHSNNLSPSLYCHVKERHNLYMVMT